MVGRVDHLHLLDGLCAFEAEFQPPNWIDAVVIGIISKNYSVDCEIVDGLRIWQLKFTGTDDS